MKNIKSNPDKKWLISVSLGIIFTVLVSLIFTYLLIKNNESYFPLIHTNLNLNITFILCLFGSLFLFHFKLKKTHKKFSKGILIGIYLSALIIIIALLKIISLSSQ